MSVIVKGINLPASCYDCNFWVQGEGTYCSATFYDVSLSEATEGRRDFCPLEEYEEEPMAKPNFTAFIRERNDAFTKAVTSDDWQAVLDYLTRYNFPRPHDEAILKASVYKAVQHCTDIPEDVKLTAREKCIALGFSPEMWL